MFTPDIVYDSHTMRVLITGASRGIGASIARTFAKKCPGAHIALVARSMDTPSHDGLQGTLAEVASDVRALGGVALPMEIDARDGRAWQEGMRAVVDSFSGLDVLVNNASALHLDRSTKLKHMDLLHQVNARATMLAIQECEKALEKSQGSIVTMSPPVRMGRLDYIRNHPSYTISKYSMTLATLGAASERVRANCLWPKHTVATAATKRLEAHHVPGAFSKGREPSLIAECVYKLAVEDAHVNAQALLDEDVINLPACDAPLDLFVEDTAPTPMYA